MKTLQIAHNPETGRCHVVSPQSRLQHRHITTITRVPDKANPIPLCTYLEKHPAKRGNSVQYRDISKPLMRRK